MSDRSKAKREECRSSKGGSVTIQPVKETKKVNKEETGANHANKT